MKTSLGAKIRAIALLASLAMLPVRCTNRISPPGEPTGGSWTPVVVPAGDAIRSPPPPQSGSEEERREIETLHELQNQRSADPSVDAAIAFWNTGATVRWNEIARELVAKHRMSHPLASRAYALLSIADYDA